MKMAKFKIWMVALTALMGISLTSCFDSGDTESQFDGAGYVRVKGSVFSYYFEDMLGNQYYPTTASLSLMEANYGFKISESNFCLIYFKDVPAEGATSKAITKKNISLVSAAEYDGPTPLVVGDAEEMKTVAPENEPVLTVAPVDNYNNSMKPYLFDKETLAMCIGIRLSADSQEAFKKHTLNLVCVTDEIEADDTELVLYLRHDNGGDKATGPNYARWYGYNIRAAVNAFMMKTGKEPAKLVVKAKESTTSSELPEKYTDYPLEYKVILN